MIHFTGQRQTREDAKIHRCDCGSWVYADNPCGACVPQTPQEDAQAVHGDLAPIPRDRTGAVHVAMEIDGDGAHARGVDQRHERAS